MARKPPNKPEPEAEELDSEMEDHSLPEAELTFTEKLKMAHHATSLFERDGDIAKTILDHRYGDWIYETVVQAIERETQRLIGVDVSLNEDIGEARENIERMVASVARLLQNANLTARQQAAAQVPRAPQPQQQRPNAAQALARRQPQRHQEEEDDENLPKHW